MKNLFRTTSFTPMIKVSTNGLVAVGGNNICYITNPTNGFITNFDMPSDQDNVDVGNFEPSNLIFLVPSNEAKNSIHTVTSMCWNKTKSDEQERLLVSWNCHSLVVYTEKTEQTTPSSLWCISNDISHIINLYFKELWGKSVEHKINNEEYIKRKYSLFIVDAQFTDKNDIAVLTGNTFMILSEPYDSIISINLKMYSKHFVSFQKNETTHFIFGRIDGCLDLLEFKNKSFTFVKTEIMEKDYCVPLSIIIYQDKIFVLKSTQIKVVDLKTFQCISSLEIGLCTTCCLNTESSLLFQDYQFNIKKLNLNNNEISTIANNIVSFDLSSEGNIYSLIPLQNSLSRSVFPNHLLVIYKRDKGMEEIKENEIPKINEELSSLWKEYDLNLTNLITEDSVIRNESINEINQLQIDITANILLKWITYLKSEGIILSKLPTFIHDLLQRYFCFIGNYELPNWTNEYKGIFEYTCPLCKQSCIIKKNQIVCPLSHCFKLCVITKQPVVKVYKSWKCMRCNSCSIFPLLSSHEQELLKPLLNTIQCTSTTCFYCGSGLKNLLYI
ncbi:hypothetical protein ENUP19_0085G0067 [Entamoeba nuttalli]|uniref:Uncharacterized protein n=2 Tax=Entamoeba nuttalli TaxID=412467 RepID=K2H3H3_ENTNP|nr:hypothetical protein ENU1_212840 [Entamoeba nuttalli P19]EKE36989.1 hypothetical protein ENU1_212840 [Entamoeba nuttalli P19]|eukprot:XP_008860668.1 hypothetical protein ENU1_212840 [Entamoeba nuttalli P19]